MSRTLAHYVMPFIASMEKTTKYLQRNLPVTNIKHPTRQYPLAYLLSPSHRFEPSKKATLTMSMMIVLNGRRKRLCTWLNRSKKSPMSDSKNIEFLWSQMCGLNAALHFMVEEFGLVKIIEGIGEDDAAAFCSCLPKITEAVGWGRHCLLQPNSGSGSRHRKECSECGIVFFPKIDQ